MPQLFASVAKLASQPLPPLPSQSPKPTTQPLQVAPSASKKPATPRSARARNVLTLPLRRHAPPLPQCASTTHATQVVVLGSQRGVSIGHEPQATASTVAPARLNRAGSSIV